MWAKLFLYLAGPIAIRVLTTLGLGVVTYIGFDAALTSIFNQIQAQFGTLSAELAGLLFLSGIPTAMSMIMSAMFARIAIVQVSKIQRL
jgi:hypothetical protein